MPISASPRCAIPAYAPATAPLSTASHFWPHGLAFIAVPLVLGSIPGALTFALNPDAATDIGLTAVPVPAWVFVAVWMIIYPSMGVAAWQLWRQQATRAEACVPLALLIAGFLQTNIFWLSDGLRSVAIADATGVLLAATTVWVFTRYSRTAARWLLPWLAWMPVTLAIKVGVLTDALGHL